MSNLDLPQIIPPDEPPEEEIKEVVEEQMPEIKEKEYVVPEEVFTKAEEFEKHIDAPVVKKVKKKRTMTPEMLEKLAVARAKANETRKRNKELRKKGELKTPSQIKEDKKKEIEEKKRPVVNNITNEYKTVHNTLTSAEIERISQEATAKALLVYEEQRKERKAEKKRLQEEQKKQDEMKKTINLAMNGGMNYGGSSYRRKKNSIFG